MKVIAKNRRAKFDYQLEDTYTAGLVLSGQEAKSIRTGNVSLAGSYITLRNSEGWLLNAHVGKYKHANIDNYEPTQSRKLLLKKSELKKLQAAKQNGRTIVPTAIGLVGKYIKLEIATAVGKKTHDKRQTIKQRDQNISIQKTLKNQ